MNQTLEDMLHMYVMDQQKRWEELLPLVEFAYNNSYESTIKMVHFEFLYGRPCRMLLSWDRLEDRVLMGPEGIQEMEEKMQTIRQRIKEAQDRQKSYADAHRVDCSYDVSDRVFLWVKPHKSSFKLGKVDKLSPRFVDLSMIVERKRPMAYRLALPDSLRRMHDVFHVSILRHYISDPTHVIDMSSLQVSAKREFTAELVRILDHHV
jgi:hypothetical protein